MTLEEAPLNDEQPSVQLTIILRHDHSIAMEERDSYLAERGWWENFPPEGCRVVSWNVTMGLGHIVVLSVPLDRISAVNVDVEKRAWGVFTTEFYVSYDFTPIREQITARYRGRQHD